MASFYEYPRQWRRNSFVPNKVPPPDDACDLTAHRTQYPPAAYPYRAGNAWTSKVPPPDDEAVLTAHREQFAATTYPYRAGKVWRSTFPPPAAAPSEEEELLTVHRRHVALFTAPYRPGDAWICSFNTQNQEEDELLTVQRKEVALFTVPYHPGDAWVTSIPPEDYEILSAHRQIWSVAKETYTPGTGFAKWLVPEDDLFQARRVWFPSTVLPYPPGKGIVGTFVPPPDDNLDQTGHRAQYPLAAWPYRPGFAWITKYPPLEVIIPEEEELLTVHRVSYRCIVYPYVRGKGVVGYYVPLVSPVMALTINQVQTFGVIGEQDDRGMFDTPTGLV